MTNSRIIVTLAAMIVLLAVLALEIDRQSHRGRQPRPGPTPASAVAR